MRPPIKWCGGKTQLLPELRKRVPKTFKRYFEPFVGGGALFFDLQETHQTMSGAALTCSLSDSNASLVHCYEAIANHSRVFLDAAHALARQYNAAGLDQMDVYYAARDSFNRAASGNISVKMIETAALFLFLNKTGFNGLYRVNRDGKFNVPWGKRDTFVVDEENILACRAALQGVTLKVGDFEASVAGATKGDFCYFDPPYVPASATSNFAAYQKEGFGYEEQVRLRNVALSLKARGVNVLLSNSDTEIVRSLYGGHMGGFTFAIERVEARRNINSKGSGRGAVGEVLIS